MSAGTSVFLLFSAIVIIIFVLREIRNKKEKNKPNPIDFLYKFHKKLSDQWYCLFIDEFDNMGLDKKELQVETSFFSAWMISVSLCSNNLKSLDEFFIVNFIKEAFQEEAYERVYSEIIKRYDLYNNIIRKVSESRDAQVQYLYPLFKQAFAGEKTDILNIAKYSSITEYDKQLLFAKNLTRISHVLSKNMPTFLARCKSSDLFIPEV